MSIFVLAKMLLSLAAKTDTDLIYEFDLTDQEFEYIQYLAEAAQ